jgi:hypothetical protein
MKNLGSLLPECSRGTDIHHVDFSHGIAPDSMIRDGDSPTESNKVQHIQDMASWQA